MISSKIVADDVVILFADIQAGIVDRPLTVPNDRLLKSVRALAKVAKAMETPVIVSAVSPWDGSEIKIASEITDSLGELPIYVRTGGDSFENAAIRKAIEETGRKTILISGVATEIAVQLPALTCASLGYRVFVVVDAVAGLSERTEEAALRRMAQSGVSTVSVISVTCEMAGDFSQPKAQQALSAAFEAIRPQG
jgi:nicotinamidase-related amidase